MTGYDQTIDPISAKVETNRLLERPCEVIHAAKLAGDSSAVGVRERTKADAAVAGHGFEDGFRIDLIFRGECADRTGDALLVLDIGGHDPRMRIIGRIEFRIECTPLMPVIQKGAEPAQSR